jgi:hypothetical protein
LPGAEFKWLAVVFGMLTGLAGTRLRSGVAATMRSRSVSRVDWIPLLWAASIFLMLLDYWWVIHDLQDVVKEWTYPEFLQALTSPLILFFAAALVLPSSELKFGESHQSLFDSHGHWALFCISAYHLEELLEAAEFFGADIYSRPGLVVLAEAALPVVAFFCGRRLHLVIASLYLAVNVGFIFVSINDLAEMWRS